jgi:hypothetical protein
MEHFCVYSGDCLLRFSFRNSEWTVQCAHGDMHYVLTTDSFTSKQKGMEFKCGLEFENFRKIMTNRSLCAHSSDLVGNAIRACTRIPSMGIELRYTLVCTETPQQIEINELRIQMRKLEDEVCALRKAVAQVRIDLFYDKVKNKITFRPRDPNDKSLSDAFFETLLHMMRNLFVIAYSQSERLNVCLGNKKKISSLERKTTLSFLKSIGIDEFKCFDDFIENCPNACYCVLEFVKTELNSGGSRLEREFDFVRIFHSDVFVASEVRIEKADEYLKQLLIGRKTVDSKNLIKQMNECNITEIYVGSFYILRNANKVYPVNSRKEGVSLAQKLTRTHMNSWQYVYNYYTDEHFVSEAFNP